MISVRCIHNKNKKRKVFSQNIVRYKTEKERMQIYYCKRPNLLINAIGIVSMAAKCESKLLKRIFFIKIVNVVTRHLRKSAHGVLQSVTIYVCI